MRGRPLRSIAPQEITAFRRDGAVLIEGILSQEWVDLVGEGVDRASAEPDGMSVDIGAGLRIDQFPASREKSLNRLVHESPLAEIVGSALQSPVRFYMDQMFRKPAGMIEPTQWHQDTSYYNIEGHDVIRAWVCADRAPRNVSIEVVRGSHLWNVAYRPPLEARDPETDADARVMLANSKPDEPMLGADSHNKWSYEAGVWDKSLPPLPDIQSRRDSFEILGWDYAPGDVLLFHGNILHGAAGGVELPHPRRAHASLWAGRDVRYLHRIGQLIPDPVALYSYQPKTGQPLSDFPDVFPIAWSPEGTP